MRQDYEFAEFLVAAWRLANPGERLPTSHGLLDQALERVSGDLPEQFRGYLSFFDGRTGRLCRELPAVLRSAQESFLTSEPNPTYLTAEVKIDSFLAHDLLDELGITPDSADAFGKTLKQAIVSEISSRAKSAREPANAT
jgi:hypothetical protein